MFLFDGMAKFNCKTSDDFVVENGTIKFISKCENYRTHSEFDWFFEIYRILVTVFLSLMFEMNNLNSIILSILQEYNAS